MRHQEYGLDSRLVCEIRVKNHLDDCWTSWFGDLSTTKLDSGEVLFSGTVSDQAALFGLLNRIRDLNLKVVSISIRAWKETGGADE
jgi:hypothetical protein